MTALLALALLPLAAQERTERAYVFRFVPDEDIFYVPWSGNGEELARLENCVAQLRGRILGKEVPVHVDGYCNSAGSGAANLAVAKTRSNRVKSELIVRQKLTEECFVTHNHSGGGNYVTVRLVVPAEPVPVEEPVTDTTRNEVQRPDTATAVKRITDGKTPAEPVPAASGPAAVSETTAQPRKDSTAAPTLSEAKPDAQAGWYAGIQAGLPFGVSAFSSFGEGKTRTGWSTGVYGGYRFNGIFSLEAQAAWGRLDLSPRGCCPDYWLGSDGRIYEGAAAGMEGWEWHGLKSCVSVQRYGVQCNVDILGLFAATKGGRWNLELSPQLNATGTKAVFRKTAGNGEAMRGATRWHFGAGGNVQVGYRLTKHLQAGVYTSLTYYTGAPIDGTPKYLHRANYVWESGVRLGWHFGNKEKEAHR